MRCFAIGSSGYASELYDNVLEGWKRMEFCGTAEHHGKRTEVVWMNFNPEIQISIDDFLNQGQEGK